MSFAEKDEELQRVTQEKEKLLEKLAAQVNETADVSTF